VPAVNARIASRRVVNIRLNICSRAGPSIPGSARCNRSQCRVRRHHTLGKGAVLEVKSAGLSLRFVDGTVFPGAR